MCLPSSSSNSGQPLSAHDTIHFFLHDEWRWVSFVHECGSCGKRRVWRLGCLVYWGRIQALPHPKMRTFFARYKGLDWGCKRTKDDVRSVVRCGVGLGCALGMFHGFVFSPCITMSQRTDPFCQPSQLWTVLHASFRVPSLSFFLSFFIPTVVFVDVSSVLFPDYRGRMRRTDPFSSSFSMDTPCVCSLMGILVFSSCLVVVVVVAMCLVSPMVLCPFPWTRREGLPSKAPSRSSGVGCGANSTTCDSGT